MCSSYGWCQFCSDLKKCPTYTHACPTGTYQSGMSCYSNNCSIDHCQFCTSNTVYVQCRSPFSLINGLCSLWELYDSILNTCSSCSVQGCSNCDGPLSCLVCKSGYNLLNNKCCPAMIFDNSTNECKQCPVFSYYDSLLNKCINSSDCGSITAMTLACNAEDKQNLNESSSNATIIVSVLVPVVVLLIIFGLCVLKKKKIEKKSKEA